MLTARFPRMIPSTAQNRTVDQLLDSVFREFPAFGASTRPFPSMNAWEDAASLYVEAELPGFRIDDLDITFSGNELTISGTRAETKLEGAAFFRRERTSGTFTRTLRIGSEIDGSKVSATLVNGVLTVVLPKAEAAKPRKIDVKVN